MLIKKSQEKLQTLTKHVNRGIPNLNSITHQYTLYHKKKESIEADISDTDSDLSNKASKSMFQYLRFKDKIKI